MIVPYTVLLNICFCQQENFVMLCPSDASSKLPCEETSPKERKRKRTPPKRYCHLLILIF